MSESPDGNHKPNEATANGSPGELTWGVPAARLVRASLIALCGVTLALLTIHPLNSYDVWTHLATGRLMWEERRIPDHEPYSYSQNREVTLEEAAPTMVVAERVLLKQPRTMPNAPPFELVAAAGTVFDNELKLRLKKAGIPLEEVKLKLEPPLKRLTQDAVDAKGNVIVKSGTLLEEDEIERLRDAGITTVHVTVPWVNHEWLYQVLAYLSYKAWGLSGPIFYRAAILMVAYLFVFLAVYRRQTHVIGIFAVFLAAITSYKRFYMRPELFSIMFTAVWVYLIERFRHRQSNWSICVTAPLLMIVWINTHGYFILGIAIMLIYLIGEGLQGLLFREPTRSSQVLRRLATRTLLWRENIITGKGWRILAVATLLSIAATFVNPYGLDGARYPIDVLGQVADPTSVIRTVIGEMQPPFNFSFTYAVIYTWVLIWLCGVSWVFNLRRLKFSRLILYVLSIIFLSKALRNMPFFGIPAGVYLALNVNEGWRDAVRWLERRIIPQALVWGKRAVQLALAGLLVFFIIWMPSDRFYVYDVSSVRFGLGYTEGKFSMGAVEFIRDHPVKGNLCNAFGMGGLCMWKLYPEKRPGPDGEPRLHYGGRRLFIDGRAELYGGPFVKAYTRSLGDEKLWKGLDDKFNFQVVFMNWQASDTHPLIARLYRSDEWRLCYGDGVGYVFVRDTPANRAVIEEARRQLESPPFVDVAGPCARLAGCLPGVPSQAEFVRMQQEIWDFAQILNADPVVANRVRLTSDRPAQVKFHRRYMVNAYDRFREYVPILPERVISPGQMTGRAGFALTLGYGELADAIVKGLMKLSPELPEFHMQRATICQARAAALSARGQREQARSELEMALVYFREAEKLNSLYPGLILSLMNLSDQLGDVRLTGHYVQRAQRKLYPNVANTTSVGSMCLKYNQARLALKLYRVALKQLPERDASPAYERIASCQVRLKDFHNAMANVTRAIDLDETNSTAWRTLGFTLESMQRWSDAIEAFKRHIQVNEAKRALQTDSAQRGVTERANALAWFRIGLCHKQLREWEAAKRAFEACLRLNPNYKEASIQLQQLSGLRRNPARRGIPKRP